MIEENALEDALEDVRALVAADGGELALTSIDGDTVHVALILDTAECRECVMPGALLEQVALDMLQPNVSGLAAVVVDDPRGPT